MLSVTSANNPTLIGFGSGAGTLQGYGTNDNPGVPIGYSAPSYPDTSGGGGAVDYGGGGSYSSGGSYSGGTTYVAPDPYAAWGGKAAYDSLINGYNTQNNQIISSAGDAVNNSGTQLNGSILDFIDSLRGAETKVDNQAVQNDLSRKQGTLGVLGMVGRGIRSGGILLGNKNAGDSSAVGALANAYGDIGRRQLTSVGNQYAQGLDRVNQGYADVEMQRAQGIRHISDSKTQMINNIVLDARQKLAALDAQIASSNLPNRINIDGEKEQVRQSALQQLQQYDQMLASQSAGVNPMSEDARRSKAESLFSAGTAPDNAFSFTDQTPAVLQGSGPTAGELPLFTLPRGAKQNEFA